MRTKQNNFTHKNENKILILKAQVQLLFDNIIASILGYIVSAFTLLFLIRDEINQTNAYIWSILIIFITLVRALLALSYRRRYQHFSIKQWYLIFLIVAISSAIIWGLAPFLIFPESTEYQLIMIVIFSGLAAGSISTLTASWLIVASFLLITITPLSISLFLENSDKSQVLTLLSLFFLVLMLMTSRKINKTIKENLTLHIESSQRQKELQIQRDAAEQATEVKGKFLATMSHEIRTPMNGILGMSEVLSETKLTKQQKDYLEIISNSGKTLLAIINDILDFSKVESGQMQIEPVIFNLPKHIDEILTQLTSKFTEKNIELKVDIDPLCPYKIKADMVRIRQVLFNLIGNAIKFTHKGHILVRVSVQKTKQDNFVNLLVEVEDTGIGIADNAKKQLFDTFTQADSSTTRLYGGTGLGLSISKKIIELMGEQLNFKSTLGKGSTFFFSLNAEVIEQNNIGSDALHQYYIPPPHKSELSSSFSNLKLLLVEDNTINQKVAFAMLKNLGITNVSTANNGQEALELFIENEQQFDLILMDCQMPVMDGYDATRKIRSSNHRNSKTLPIIALTANALDSDRKKCLQVGMNDFISKPVKKSNLDRVIKHWV